MTARADARGATRSHGIVDAPPLVPGATAIADVDGDGFPDICGLAGDHVAARAARAMASVRRCRSRRSRAPPPTASRSVTSTATATPMRAS